MNVDICMCVYVCVCLYACMYSACLWHVCACVYVCTCLCLSVGYVHFNFHGDL